MCGKKFSRSSQLLEHNRLSHPPPGMVSSNVAMVARKGQVKAITKQVMKSDVVTVSNKDLMKTMVSQKSVSAPVTIATPILKTGQVTMPTESKALTTDTQDRQQDSHLRKHADKVIQSDNIYCLTSTDCNQGQLVSIATKSEDDLESRTKYSVQTVSYECPENIYEGDTKETVKDEDVTVVNMNSVDKNVAMETDFKEKLDDKSAKVQSEVKHQTAISYEEIVVNSTPICVEHTVHGSKGNMEDSKVVIVTEKQASSVTFTNSIESQQLKRANRLKHPSFNKIVEETSVPESHDENDDVTMETN